MMEALEMNSGVESAVYRLLDRIGADYMKIEHEPADTMEICAGIERHLGAPICKNLFLCNRQQTDFYLLMIPAGKVFKTNIFLPSSDARGFLSHRKSRWWSILGYAPDLCLRWGL